MCARRIVVRLGPGDVLMVERLASGNMSCSPDDIPPLADDARIQRLEEALGFTEHTVDELSDQVRALGTQMDACLRRLTALENRLAAMQNGQGDPEPSGDEFPDIGTTNDSGQQ
jgi:uncharacterized coiled-coil protein SlyX